MTDSSAGAQSSPRPSEQPVGPTVSEADFASFSDFIEAKREQAERLYTQLATEPEYPDLLAEALALYTRIDDFKVGDFVQWKPMMKNRRFPIESVPAVVVSRINPPSETDRGGNRLIEPRDLLIGVVDGDRDFFLMEVASRRFALWQMQ
jgi:hypothetical protein